MNENKLMKKQLNEIKRMQQIAGILNEDISVDDQGNLQVEYKFKIGQTVESYGDEIVHKIRDKRPNWEAVEEDSYGSDFIMKNTELTLNDENMYEPWYLIEPINKEEDGDYIFWWPEDELELKSTEDDIDLSDTPYFGNPLYKVLKKASAVLSKHKDGLRAALKARQADPEDIDAYNTVKTHLETIADELGLDSTISFMEDEMYSGKVSVEEAWQYTEKMFSDLIEDTI